MRGTEDEKKGTGAGSHRAVEEGISGCGVLSGL